MTYINEVCADAGTVNCPCPLAVTGDCLICSRLSGKDECDCRWAGVCIYNEYIQNDKIIRNVRKNVEVPVIKKIWYGADLLVMVLKVNRGFALEAAQPGAFVFVNGVGKNDFSNVPVSVMKADAEREQLWIALKVISGKTKAIASAEGSLMLRGVYRNGILGGGIYGLKEDMKINASDTGKAAAKRWMVITKGIGFAPAVNILEKSKSMVDIDILTDTEKVGGEIVSDYLKKCVIDAADERRISIESVSLKDEVDCSRRERSGIFPRAFAGKYRAEEYDRILIFASDYYIRALTEIMDIPSEKLVFCNNFRMCCGEGICGACVQLAGKDKTDKMCKCRNADVHKLCDI